MFASSGYSNHLWLEITNVGNAALAGQIHNSSPLTPYAIYSKQSLDWQAWNPEATFYGDEVTDATAFLIPLLGRDGLFLRARSTLTLRAIGSGFAHTVVLKRDGSVWAWGINDHGELGDGQWSGSPVPAQVVGLSNIIAIATPEDGFHSLALDSRGVVWSWGLGWDGQLGRNDGLYLDENTPGPVPGLTNVIAISCGYAHSVALETDGTLWAWGNNWAGQLGDGTQMERDYPQPVIGLTNAIAISSGSDHNFALCADGAVWAWGFNRDGNLGIGSTLNQLQPVRVEGLTNVAALSGGDAHSLALLSDGTVMAWGCGRYGELGNGDYTDSLTPVPVSALSNIVAIASGGYHNLAIDDTGTLFEWGDGEWDQLGNGVEDTFETAFPLQSFTNTVGVAAGEYNSVVMTADGKIYQWGIYGYLDSFDWRQQMFPFMFDPYNTLDSDGDLLPDWFEAQFGTVTNSPDSFDCGVTDYELVYLGFDPDNPPQLQLGLWKFDTADLIGDAGQLPITSTNLQRVPDWSGNAFHIGDNSPAWLAYREAETNISKVIYPDYNMAVTQANYSANITLRQGTIRFWFRPDWTSTSLGGQGPGTNAALLALGNHSIEFTNYWGLEFDAPGNNLIFGSESKGNQYVYCQAPAAFSSNHWYEIAIIYDTNRSVIYTNGQAAASGNGVQACPEPALRRSLPFHIGSIAGGNNQAFGLFDNLETFNYPLSPSQVADGYFQAWTNITFQSPPLLVTTNYIGAVFQGAPSVTVAVLVNDTNNYTGAIGQTYDSDPATGQINLPVNLGANDGIYRVAIGIWNGACYDWTTRKVVVDTMPPAISPANCCMTTNSSLIQLTAFAAEPLSSVTYDLVNNQATNLNQTGFVVESDGDTFAGTVSTNRFQCFDLRLAAGLNVVTVRCADLAGNVSTNVYSYTLDTATMPSPALSVDWPADGAIVSGNKVTIKGHVAGAGATVMARVTQEGAFNDYAAAVERDGTFWISDVLLPDSTNFISICATNLAGQAVTNLLTIQTSPLNLTVDPMATAGLQGDMATVSGTIDASGYDVTVNGIQAVVWTNSDETIRWQATNVPVNQNGVAAFRVQAVNVSDPEILAVFQRPTFVRVSHYRENLDFSWRSPQSLPPHDYTYDEIMLRRTRDWNNGTGGAGSSVFYMYAESYSHSGYGIVGPCQTTWQWPSEQWPPTPPDSTVSQSCSSGQFPSGNPLCFYSYWWGNAPGLGQAYAPVIPWEHKDSYLSVPSFLKTAYVTYHTASCNYDVSSQTRLELIVGGLAEPEKPCSLSLKVSARAYGNPSGWSGADTTLCLPGANDTLVSPENISIAGVKCVDSGDGINGFVTVTVPRGATNLDITPIVTTANDCYSFNVEPINLQMAVDNNRDGNISFEGSDTTSPANPYRFWINDSSEEGDIAAGSDAQIPGVPVTVPELPQPNYWFNYVRGRSDLINFFPVALDLGSALQLLPPSEGYEYHLVQNDGAVKFIYTSLTPQNAFEYLTDITSTGYGADSGEAATNAGTVQVLSAPGTLLNSTWLDRTRMHGGTGVILVEGNAATTRPLWLEIWRNGKLLFGSPLYLSVSPVELMFRHKNLMAAAAGTGGAPDRLLDSDVPNEPSVRNRNLVFLHGYNVNPEQARGVHSEMFKRFYWSGSKARFYGITWNGADSQLFGYVTPNYHTNVVHAVSTAPDLANFLRGLPGRTTVAAHSLGNMVVLSALNDYHAPVDKYFMIDAAVPIEALDGAAATSPDMPNPDWAAYDTRLWASEWHSLFPTNDARSSLTWRDRFSDFGTADVYNFYSSGEEVLRTQAGAPPASLLSALYDQALAFLEGEGGAYVWVWQEKAKGIMSGNTLVGSAYGGWGFNIFDGYLPEYPIWYVGLPGGRRAKAPAELETVTDDILTGCQFNPLFKSGWGGYLANNPSQVYVTTDTQYFTGPNWILGLYQSESGSTIAEDLIKNTQLLADAFPALTLPVGANPVSVLDQPNTSHNIDMQAEFEKFWPPSRPPRQVGAEANGEWHHSDFDCVAFPFIYPLFEQMIELGDLK